MPSGGKTAVARSQAGLQEGLKYDSVCLFTFSEVSNAGILLTFFT